MLIQRDNLEALKALLPFYAGTVKRIYIDRPATRSRPSSISGRRCRRPPHEPRFRRNARRTWSRAW